MHLLYKKKPTLEEGWETIEKGCLIARQPFFFGIPTAA